MSVKTSQAQCAGIGCGNNRSALGCDVRWMWIGWVQGEPRVKADLLQNEVLEGADELAAELGAAPH